MEKSNSDNLKKYDKQHVTVHIREDLNSVCIKTVYLLRENKDLLLLSPKGKLK